MEYICKYGCVKGIYAKQKRIKPVRIKTLALFAYVYFGRCGSDKRSPRAMMSTAIRTAAPRKWGSRHGRRAAMDGFCDRRVTVKRYTRRRVKVAVVKAADAVVHTPPRVCSDCRTSETPLWRSGPGGPKVAFHSSVNPSVPLLPTLFPFHLRFCVLRA